jgi:integrative and conjugative element protein (TIGR02256 family)
MRSQGQVWAVGQLTELVEASNGAFELFDETDPAEPGPDLTVFVTIDCSGFERKEGGASFKARERLRIVIPADFPLSIPRVYFTHKRLADNPHVQWGEYICLYQAPDVEWNFGRGMFGFMRRLDEWLRAAAAGTLDPIGMPLHPPVEYSVGHLYVVPRQDTPSPTPPYWSGYVEITREDKVVAELGRWIERDGTIPDTRLATAFLLPGTMPHEYPASVSDLVVALLSRGIPLEVLRLTIQVGVLRTNPGDRAMFVLGAAMRGIVGEERKQHLACWRIDADLTDVFRAAALAATDDNPIDEKVFYGWASKAQVEWCRVVEDRPEIVERRDSESPASWWRGKSVALLGCGAIGSAVGLMLARAGVARIRLYDNGIITPGILVRQGFPRRHVGRTKVSSLKLAALDANPDIDVSTDHRNLVGAFADEGRIAGILDADVIIDATASPTVSAAFEAHFRVHAKRHPPVVSMVLGHRCDFGMMTLATDTGPGMGIHLDRRAKLAFANSGRGRRFLEEFWPSDPARRVLFQPEPGCSSPTFRGSYIDVLGLAARMTNVASRWLAAPDMEPRAFAMDLSGDGIADGPAREIELALEPPIAFTEGRRGYEIRLSAEALNSMRGWARRTRRVHRDQTETGGILFGQIDAFLRIVWIDEASGPPPDSLASPEGFVCGTDGVSAMNDEKVARTSNSIAFIGMWHTHPEGLPIPSSTDLKAMRELLRTGGAYTGRSFLMLIFGGTPATPLISAGLYERADYAGS